VDKKEVIKLLAGTVARGLMWGIATLSAYLGTETLDEDTTGKLAYFLTSVAVAIIATIWSKKKDTKLAAAEPKNETNDKL